MSPEERQLLTGLFDRIKTASATPRDHDAEVLIEQATREQPYAAYYLAQAVIVQEKGLEAASLRIKELEARVHQLETAAPAPQQSGGFLSSIFGAGQAQQPQPQPAAPASSGPWGSAGQRQDYSGARGYDDSYRAPPPPQQSAPWSGQQAAPAAPSAGGSFLRGALGTAAGVAGGMLLANSLSGIFSNHANSLGWGSPFAGSNPFGNELGNRSEETVINNYYGDSAGRDDSGSNSISDNSDGGSGSGDGGWQQADYDGSDSSDFGDDDSMNA